MASARRSFPAVLTVAVGLVVLLALPPAHSPAPSAAASGAEPALSILPSDAAGSYGLGRLPVAVGAPVRLTLALAPSDGTALRALLAEVDDPASSQYRHFLSEDAFERLYRPAPENQSALEEYFRSFGGRSFSETDDGLGLSLTLPAGRLSAALGVTLAWVGPAGASRYVASRPPSLPAALAREVVGIGGLTGPAAVQVAGSYLSARAPHPRVVSPIDRFVLDNGSQSFLGSDFATAYGDAALVPPGGSNVTGNASGYAVATLLTSSYNETANVDLPPFDPNAVDSYFNDTLPSDWPHPTIVGVPVTVDSATPPKPGPFPTLQDDTFAEAENSLDLEMVGSMAPAATVYNFYVSGGLINNETMGTSFSDAADTFAQGLSAALAYDYGALKLVAVTNSWGLPDLNDSLWDVELEHAAAIGATVLAASGDQGDAPSSETGDSVGAAPGWPATAAFSDYGVLSVGGTTPTLSGAPDGTIYPNGTLNDTFDPNVTGVASESAWYDTTGGAGSYAGTEGGISSVYAEPSWQFDSAAQPGVVNATVRQGLGQLGRALPDLAMPANNTIAYVASNSSGALYSILEGTSIAAPLVAGALAECAATTGTTFGFLDPLLYRAASYYAANPSAPSPFRAVTNGSNYEFHASGGWDALTGWGSLDVARMPAMLLNRTIGNYSYVGPTPKLPVSPPKSSSSPPSWLVYAILGLAAVVLVAAFLIALRGGSSRSATPPTSGAPRGPTPPPVVRHFCPSCRREYPPGSIFCPWCGARL